MSAAPQLHPEPTIVRVMVDGQEIGFCPEGFAYGCFDLRSRGMGPDYANITVWNNPHFRLFTGGDTHYRGLNIKGMFQQEIYVYLREFGEAINEALEMLRVAPKHDVGQICEFCHVTFVSKSTLKFCTASCKAKASAWRSLQLKLATNALEKIGRKKACLYCHEDLPTSTHGRFHRFCNADCRAQFNESHRHPVEAA